MEAFESIIHNYNKMNCGILNGITPISQKVKVRCTLLALLHVSGLESTTELMGF